MSKARKKIVIVGAGFAGVYAMKSLKGVDADVLLIDRNNYHTFQPLIYQVATAGLEPEEVSRNLRTIFHEQKNFSFLQGTVVGVDWKSRALELAGGDTVDFDYLIIGAGAIYNDFGIPGVADHAFYLKSLTEAVNIRSHILRQFERASAHPKLIDDGILNVVIVGGGPTGVEMAGALTELFDKVLPKDYPHLDIAKAKIVLIEMQDHLLPPYSEESRAYTEKVLRERGVDIRLGEALKEARGGEVELKSGEVIPTETLIWAAGVRGHPLAEALDVALERGYRIKVNPDLSLPEHPYAFALGDIAASQDAEGKLYPQVATVAIQHGQHVAKNLKREFKGKARKPFTYFDKGSMAIIGRSAGVAELSKNLGGFHLRGFLGWLAWLMIHLVYLPGHRNRFNAFVDWVYGYLTFERRTRLIMDMTPTPIEVTSRKSIRTSKIDNHLDDAGTPEANSPTAEPQGV